MFATSQYLDLEQAMILSMRRTLPVSRRGHRQGYVMLIALIAMAILAIIGTSTLRVAGVDQRVAIQNRKHMLTVNTSHAGTEHARQALMYEDPADEGLDSGVDTGGDFVTSAEAETSFEGVAYAQNLGVYSVEAIYHRCGNPPPGYSTEQGTNKFRSDYWEMASTARFVAAVGGDPMNETQARTTSLVRKVKFGSCKIR